MRVDKWLWVVRVFKTRSMSTDACKGGKVKVDGSNAKASREIKVGDIIEVQQSTIKKKLKILKLHTSRVGAKFVADLMEDLTPAAEYERLDMMRKLNHEKRDRGEGRPTKRDRREIDKLKDL